MLFELVDSALRDPQAFPNGVATLNHAVQHADFGIFALHKAIDPAPGSSISWVGLVEFGHRSVLTMHVVRQGNVPSIGPSVLANGAVCCHDAVFAVPIRCSCGRRRTSIWPKRHLQTVHQPMPSQHAVKPWQFQRFTELRQNGLGVGEQRFSSDDHRIGHFQGCDAGARIRGQAWSGMPYVPGRKEARHRDDGSR